MVSVVEKMRDIPHWLQCPISKLRNCPICSLFGAYYDTEGCRYLKHHAQKIDVLMCIRREASSTTASYHLMYYSGGIYSAAVRLRVGTVVPLHHEDTSWHFYSVNHAPVGGLVRQFYANSRQMTNRTQSARSAAQYIHLMRVYIGELSTTVLAGLKNEQQLAMQGQYSAAAVSEITNASGLVMRRTVSKSPDKPV